jgi:probable phosphoglycerate mutase
MHLYLIRHGETFSNAEGRIQGQTDNPLSPLGERQALATARSLHSVPVDALLASPLARARRTAEILGDEMRLSVETADALMEIHAGVFQGLLWTECEARYPEAAAAWISEDPDFVIPGGESRRQLMQRGTQALTEIRSRGFRRVVVVSHGGVLGAALKGLLHVPAERNPFRLANCAITELAWDSNPVVVRMNDVNHLERLHADDGAGRTGDL